MARLVRCSVCGKPRGWNAPCKCDKAAADADKAAAEWAAKQGEKVPREDHKTGLCGDRMPSVAQRRSVYEGMCSAEYLRDYRASIPPRLDAIGKRVKELLDEKERLELEEKILDLYLAGMTMEEIARQFDRNSHSFVSEHMRRIWAAAHVQAMYLGVRCRLCLQPIPRERRISGGRPAEFCSDRHRSTFHARLKRTRARLPSMLTSMPPAVTAALVADLPSILSSTEASESQGTLDATAGTEHAGGGEERGGRGGRRRAG